MPLGISPPLINSSNPWATTERDLSALYDCPYTGAVTTRTSLFGKGFKHDDDVHQYAFFDAQGNITEHDQQTPGIGMSSLNTLGYSPISVQGYLETISRISQKSNLQLFDPVDAAPRAPKKPFIVSVTGTPEAVADCYKLIRTRAKELGHRLMMEVNLSCPNIAGKPPPAYDGKALHAYLSALQAAHDDGELPVVPTGIKTPPYTYVGQFEVLIQALLSTCKGDKTCPVSFITATNTLGSSLLMSPSTVDGEEMWTPSLPSEVGTGIGGLAGAALHPLALGNVATLRRMLDDAAQPIEDGESTGRAGDRAATGERRHALQHVEIIGIGGVNDAAGYARMKAAGASCVGIGTALGVQSVDIFREVIEGS